MKRIFMLALAGAVVVIGASVPAVAVEVRAICHQRCVDAFQRCANLAATRHASLPACQRTFQVCQQNC